MNGKLIFCMSLFLSSLVIAQEPSKRGWYLGLDAGISESEFNDSDAMTGLIFGFRFNRWIALEGGLADYGEFPIRNEGLEIAQSDVVGAKALAVAMFPLTQKFSLMAKLGVLYNERDEVFRIYSDNPSETVEVNQSDTSFATELGMLFDLSKHMSLSLDWGYYLIDDIAYVDFGGLSPYESIANPDDLNVVKLGLRYRF